LLVALACGCGGGQAAPDAAPAAFPADYAASYVQVRPCHPSPDHDLNNVIVLVDPDAADTYMMRDQPFATGAVVLKEEYPISDKSCAGPILQWTAMVKLPDGSSSTTLDWHWQKVDADRHVLTDDEPRCISCHTTCGSPDNGGYEGTCSPPL
jgi:hypothetical protein